MRFETPAQLLDRLSSDRLTENDKIAYLQACTHRGSPHVSGSTMSICHNQAFSPSHMPHRQSTEHWLRRGPGSAPFWPAKRPCSVSLRSSSWLLWNTNTISKSTRTRVTKPGGSRRPDRRLWKQPRKIEGTAETGADEHHNVDTIDDPTAWATLTESGRQLIARVQQYRAKFPIDAVPVSIDAGFTRSVAMSLQKRMACGAMMSFYAEYELVEAPSSYDFGPMSCYLKTTSDILPELYQPDFKRTYFCGHPKCIGEAGNFLCFEDGPSKWRHDGDVHPPQPRASAVKKGIWMECPIADPQLCEYAVARHRLWTLKEHLRKKHKLTKDAIEALPIVQHCTLNPMNSQLGAINTFESSITSLMADASTPFVSWSLKTKLRLAQKIAGRSNKIRFTTEDEPEQASPDPTLPQYRYRHTYYTPWISSIPPPVGRRRARYPGQPEVFAACFGKG